MKGTAKKEKKLSKFWKSLEWIFYIDVDAVDTFWAHGEMLLISSDHYYALNRFTLCLTLGRKASTSLVDMFDVRERRAHDQKIEKLKVEAS